MGGAAAFYFPPATGGTSCPNPMTRAALVAMRDAGTLSKDCDYVITNHVQGRLVAGTSLHLQAVDNKTLSMHAQVKSTYDNVAWEGRYDIDTGLVYELRDNRNNTVIGAAAVAAFDWGNTAYTDCRVEHSTWNVTIGSTVPMSKVRVLDGSVMTTTGVTGGGVTNVTVGPTSSLNLTNSNLQVRDSSLRNGAALNATGFTGGGAGVYRSDLIDGCAVTFGAGAGAVQMYYSAVRGSTSISHTGSGGFTLNSSLVADNASITHSSTGALTLSGSQVIGVATSITHTAGSISMSGTQIGPYGRVLKNNAASTGTLTMNYCVVDTVGYVQQLGAGPLSMTGVRIHSNSNINVPATANTSAGMAVNYTRIDQQSGVTFSATAGAMSVTGCDIASGSNITKSGAGALTANSVTLQSNSSVNLSGVRGLTVSQASLRGFGRVTAAATGGAGVTDILQQSSVQDYGLIQFNATGAAGNQVLYSSVRGLTGNISFNGTNTGAVVSRMTVDNGSVAFSNNVAMPTILDIGVRDNGILNVSGCTAAQDIRYSTVGSYSRCNITNKTTAAQMFGIDVACNGTFLSQGAARNATYISVRQGQITHNGGNLTLATKEMGGTLTTGAFNHSGIQHRVNISKTLTAPNTSRADYQGLAAQLV